MATETATIRVPRSTRDLLAAQARQRGLSVAGLLAEIAREHETALIWQSERQAVRIDAGHRDVHLEEQAWDTATADGIE